MFYLSEPLIVVFLESWSEWTGSSSQFVYSSHRVWLSPPAGSPPPASSCKSPPKSHVLSPRHELEQDWWILFGGIPDRSTWPGLSLEPQVQIPGDLRTSRGLRKPKQWSESLGAGQGRLTCKDDVTPQPWQLQRPRCSFKYLQSLVGHKHPCSGPGSGGRTGSCSDWKITTPLFKQTSAAVGPKLWLHLLFGFHKCFLTAWQVSCLLSHFLFRIPRVGVRGRREILYLFSLTPFRLEAGGVLRLSLTVLKDCNQKSLDPGGPQSCGVGDHRRYPAQGHVSKHCWLGGGRWVGGCVECPLPAPDEARELWALVPWATPSDVGS